LHAEYGNACFHLSAKMALVFYAQKSNKSIFPKAFFQKTFLDSEGGSPNATLVVLLLGISYLKIPKAFLIRSGAQ